MILYDNGEKYRPIQYVLENDQITRLERTDVSDPYISPFIINKLNKVVEDNGGQGQNADWHNKRICVMLKGVDTIDELYRKLEEYGKQEAKEQKHKKYREENREVLAHAIILPSGVSICDWGFEIRISLVRFKNYSEQKEFAVRNKKKILRFIMSFITDRIDGRFRSLKKIGDLSFYEPKEMILTRDSQIIIRFEPKGDIPKILEGGEEE